MAHGFGFFAVQGLQGALGTHSLGFGEVVRLGPGPFTSDFRRVCASICEPDRLHRTTTGIRDTGSTFAFTTTSTHP